MKQMKEKIKITKNKMRNFLKVVCKPIKCVVIHRKHLISGVDHLLCVKYNFYDDIRLRLLNTV